MEIEDFCTKQLANVEFTSEQEETKFKACLFYFKGGYDDPDAFTELDKVLSAKETVGSNRMYFLSVPPTVFGNVCQNIDKFARAKVPGKIFVLVEKPFGRDSRSFADLNKLLEAAFAETELFRLDHYLAKSCIQTLARQRLQRQVFFESIWNSEHIESIHVSWKEDIGTGGRGGYFDKFGIIRDIIRKVTCCNF